jgi:hypothetical protein
MSRTRTVQQLEGASMCRTVTHASAIADESSKTDEETRNQMLDADQQCNAKRYERTADRVDSRSGSYNRNLHYLALSYSGFTARSPHFFRTPLRDATVSGYCPLSSVFLIQSCKIFRCFFGVST